VAFNKPNIGLHYFSKNMQMDRTAMPGLLPNPIKKPSDKNEMLSFAGKWMELENIILSEVSLAQKTKNRMFSLICGH
jgi:hypothetical protein